LWCRDIDGRKTFKAWEAPKIFGTAVQRVNRVLIDFDRERKLGIRHLDVDPMRQGDGSRCMVTVAARARRSDRATRRIEQVLFEDISIAFVDDEDSGHFTTWLRQTSANLDATIATLNRSFVHSAWLQLHQANRFD
jgi:hypothetical protein